MIIMNHCTYLVDPHPEGDGGDDNPALVGGPVVQRLVLRLVLPINRREEPNGKRSVVESGFESRLAQHLLHRLRFVLLPH